MIHTRSGGELTFHIDSLYPLLYRLEERGWIIGTGMGLALVGVMIGVPAALMVTRLMGGLLSGITSTDPMTYFAVVVMLAASALLASYMPARRATRVDPIVALRSE